MRFLEILSGSVSGTLMMTTYSYLAVHNKNADDKFFNFLIGKVAPKDLGLPPNNIKGWLVHYGVGLFFTMLYDQRWKHDTSFKKTLLSGCLLGSANGVVATMLWRMSKKSNNARMTKDETPLAHLLISHIVFGAFTAAAYRLPGIIRYQK